MSLGSLGIVPFNARGLAFNCNVANALSRSVLARATSREKLSRSVWSIASPCRRSHLAASRAWRSHRVAVLMASASLSVTSPLRCERRVLNRATEAVDVLFFLPALRGVARGSQAMTERTTVAGLSAGASLLWGLFGG